MKEWIRKTISVTVGGIGYILSPLTWWNDAYVNIPIAYFTASLISRHGSRLFTISFVSAYWFTNVLGLVMLQYGGTTFFNKNAAKLDRRGMFDWLGWSLAYTLAIVLLCQLGIIKPLPEYFQSK